MRPEIHVSTQRLDLGRLGPSQTVEREISVENRGGQTLRMQTPTASCGCQKPALDRLVLEPGETAQLRIRQTASTYPGAFMHTITIPSNDPIVPNVAIYLTGFMSRKIVVRPDPIFLGFLSPGETVTRSVEIASEEGSEFRLTHVQSIGSASANATLDRPDKLHRITVKFQAGDKLGPVHESINFHTDVKGEPPQVITLKGEIVGLIRPSPSALTLGTVRARAEVKRRLLLISRNGAFQLVGVSLSGGTAWRLSHKSKPLADRKQIQLDLAMSIPDFPGMVEQTLEIKVKDEQGKDVILTVPVSGAIQRGTGDGNPAE